MAVVGGLENTVDGLVELELAAEFIVYRFLIYIIQAPTNVCRW